MYLTHLPSGGNMGIFLWPMIIPLLLPLIYAIFWKKEILKDVLVLILIMAVITIIYEPIMGNLSFPYLGYTFWKVVLFVFIPAGILWLYWKKPDLKKMFGWLGVKEEGWKKSMILCLFALPVMLLIQLLTNIMMGGIAYDATPTWHTIIMFFESFTEEFLFRGIIFLYLWKLIDVRWAYVISTASFVLMHPQYFWGLGMIPAIVQGILTAVIVHKSKNLTGAWVLHGANRVVSLSILPYLL